MYSEFTENEQTQYGGAVVKNPPEPEESGGEGGGRGIRMGMHVNPWLIHVNV